MHHQHQNHLLRNAILLQLEAAAPAALPLDTIYQGVSLTGHYVSESVLHKELHYLIQREFVSSETEPLSPGIPRYALHVKGLEYLEAYGLA